MQHATRDLLAAIREALDLPLPGIATADERAYARLTAQRCSDVRVILASLLNSSAPDPAEAAATVREWTAQRPVTYSPWQNTASAGEPLYGAAAVQVREQLAGTPLHVTSRPADPVTVLADMARSLTTRLDTRVHPWDDTPPPDGSRGSTAEQALGGHTIRLSAVIVTEGETGR